MNPCLEYYVDIRYIISLVIFSLTINANRYTRKKVRGIDKKNRRLIIISYQIQCKSKKRRNYFQGNSLYVCKMTHFLNLSLRKIVDFRFIRFSKDIINFYLSTHSVYVVCVSFTFIRLHLKILREYYE